jgi:DNA modification methylase
MNSNIVVANKQLEFNNIYNLDAIEGLKEIPENSIDLVFTDPPYKLVAGGRKNSLLRNNDGENPFTTTGECFNYKTPEFKEWIPFLYPVVKESRYIFIMTNDRNMREIWDECEKAGFIFCELLVMNKGYGVPSSYFYKSCEYILMFRKGGYRKFEKFGVKNVIDVKMPKGKNKPHPTQKPDEVFIPILESCTKENEVILDPFMGSCMVAKVSERMNRQFIGFEIDNTYLEKNNIIINKKLIHDCNVEIEDNKSISKNDEVSKIILTRPAIEAGEKLGFLPGDLQSKIDPYLRPLYDALYQIMGAEGYLKNSEKGLIEVAPLAYMRGRTLDNAFIILDEAQNTTPAQMKMFLTRIGFGSKVIVTGDLTQKDLPAGTESGLDVAIKVLSKIDAVDYNAQWVTPTTGGGSVIPIVSELPSNPVNGQAVFLYNVGYKYLVIYHAETGTWYSTSLSKHTLLISDSFTRADNAGSLGNTETGQPWVTYDTWGISGNTACLIACTDTSLNRALIESGLSDVKISVTFAAYESQKVSRVWFRATNGPNALVLLSTASDYRLYKVVNGVFTQLSTASVSAAIGDRIVIVASGSSINFYLNDILRISATQTFNQTSTMHGFGALGAGAKFDDFKVERV